VGPKDIGSLYMLRLTYKIRPVEKQIPSSGELKTRAELDLVQLFVDAFAGRQPHVDDASLARRLMTHADAENIVAGLLRDHLGARGDDAPAAAAEARRARNPRPVEASAPLPVAPPAGAPVPVHEAATAAATSAPRPARSSRFARGDGGGRREPRAPAEPSSDLPDGDESFVQLFVNVGTREGLKAADLQALLSGAGIPAEDTGPVRLRDRMAFVGVRRESFDRAIDALSGQVIGGRTVVAERARARQG
jgi:ATP-dependent RNA helicase DeaD